MSLQSQILEISDRLDSISRRGEVPLYQLPPFEYEIGVPSVQNLEILGVTQDVGVTHAAISWTGASDPQVERYEIWAKNVSFQSDRPYQVADVTDAPATVQLTSDRDTTVVLSVRTIMKNGLSTSINIAPTVTTAITQTPLSAADIADGSIGDAKLDRVTDPIIIDTADIAAAAIGTAQIQNAAITNALIGNLAVDTAQIAAAAVGTAQIGTAQITNALIDTMAANKVLAGTFVAGVVYAGTVVAANILAGTMSAVNISAGTFALTSGFNVMTIDGTNGFKQLHSPSGDSIEMLGGQFLIRTSGSSRVIGQIRNDGGSIGLLNGTTNVVGLEADDIDLGQANRGYMFVKNSSGTEKVEIGVDSGGSGRIDVDGTQVIGVQGSFISDPTGGATVDAEARTAIDALIDRLQAHGLIA